MKRIVQGLLFAAALTVTAGSVAHADVPQPIQQYNSNAVWFENWSGLSNALMTVTAPDGEVLELFTASGTPVYKLPGRDVIDGIYRYELTAATEEKKKIINKIDNGRGDNASDNHAVPFYLQGHFTVSRGVIVIPEEIKEDS